MEGNTIQYGGDVEKQRWREEKQNLYMKPAGRGRKYGDNKEKMNAFTKKRGARQCTAKIKR